MTLRKPSTKDWPCAYWAVAANVYAVELVASGTAAAPRSYDEAAALRHLHEAAVAVVREHHVTKALIWGIEANARLTAAMRPRLHAEGVLCAAIASCGAAVELVAWPEIQSRSGTKHSKDELEAASEVCNVSRGGADAFALVAAIAALRA